jgi:hypothetical protein
MPIFSEKGIKWAHNENWRLIANRNLNTFQPSKTWRFYIANNETKKGVQLNHDSFYLIYKVNELL